MAIDDFEWITAHNYRFLCDGTGACTEEAGTQKCARMAREGDPNNITCPTCSKAITGKAQTGEGQLHEGFPLAPPA